MNESLLKIGIDRPSLFEIFTEVAGVIAKRSTCGEGRQHGCVLVLDNRYIVATGYNGPAAKEPACGDICDFPKKPCVAVHAEVNAIINATRIGVDLKKCVAYVTKKPCDHCSAVLRNAGVSYVHWAENQKKGGNSDRCMFPQE